MKGRGLQQTLFGVWKLGSVEQQQPVVEASPFTCEVCGATCGNAGALEVHRRINHEAVQSNFHQRPISSLLLQQIAWLKEKEEVRKEKEKKKEGLEEDSEMDDEEADDQDVDIAAADSDAQQADGAEPLEKRRGRSRRIRRSLKYKYRAIRLLEKLRLDLTEAADEEDARPPNFTDLVAVVRKYGLMEPEANLRRWFDGKEEIVNKYTDKRARKRKSIGAGRSPALPATEAHVKE